MHFDKSKVRLIREFIIVTKNVVMSRTARPEETSMALEIKVELGGMGDLTINNRACRAVTTPVGLPRVLGKESNVMPFTDDDDGDCWVDFQLSAGSFQRRKFCTRGHQHSNYSRKIAYEP